MQSEVEQLKQELSTLEEETVTLNQMSKDIDDLEEKLETNKISRDKLRKRLLSLGYKL